MDLLRPIPGLRVFAGGVKGQIDAAAAACMVVKIQSPAPPSSYPFDDHSLRSYQRIGVGQVLVHLRHHGSALLADDVGLGKTRQALTTARDLGGRTLIVCPAHCRSTWLDELNTLGQHGVLLGPVTNKAKQKAWDDAPSARYVVTSYELAERAFAAAFPHDYPTLLIMDEAHYLCGRKSKRSQALEEMAKCCRYKLALTATPMYSRPRDLYKLLRVLGIDMGYPSAFDFRYCAAKPNAWGGLDNKGRSNEEELKLRLSYYMTRREKREVLTELPPLTRQVVWVDGNEAAKRAFIKACQEERSEKAVIAALIATLDAKVDAAVQLAASAGRFVLFTYLRRHAAEIAQRLNDGGTPCVLITGDVPHEQREALARQAAAEGLGVVATIDSAGTGINSLRDVASYGIMHSVPWVPMLALQAEGRLHRMGQQGNVHWVYTAMRDSMDEVVVRTVVEKLDAARAILPSMEEGRQMRNALDDEAGSAKDVLAALYDAMDSYNGGEDEG